MSFLSSGFALRRSGAHDVHMGITSLLRLMLLSLVHVVEQSFLVQVCSDWLLSTKYFGINYLFLVLLINDFLYLWFCPLEQQYVYWPILELFKPRFLIHVCVGPTTYAYRVEIGPNRDSQHTCVSVLLYWNKERNKSFTC